MWSQNALYELRVQEGGNKMWQMHELSRVMFERVVVLPGVQSVRMRKM